MLKRIDKKKAFTILFFSAFFIYGCLVWKDYGISVDEIYERRSSLVTYKYIFPSVSSIATRSVNFADFPPFLEWRDRYYGVALQLPTVFIEHLFGFNMSVGQALMMRHAYVFLMFFIASIFFFKITRHLTGNIYMALLGTAIYILGPRTLADSFYNIKDSLFLSIFTINLYTAFKFLEKQNAKRMIAFAVATALCVNTRIVGAILIAVCLAVILVRALYRHEWKCCLPYMIGAAVLSILIYILITPVTWHSPITEMFNIYKTFSDYTAWVGNNFYLGAHYDATQLPWHYLIVWILITVPYLYIVLGVIGGITCFIPKKISAEKIMAALCLLIPVLYVVLTRPVLYNGWRHFYFIYSIIALFSVWGLDAIKSILKDRKRIQILYIVFCGALMCIGIRIWKYHPYEYSYFNPIAEKYADKNFEKDYWGVTSYELLQYMLEHDEREEGINLHIHLDWALNRLTDKERQRFELAEAHDADYIIWQPTESMTEPDGYYYFYNKEHVIEVDDIKLGALYDGNWDLYSTCILEEKKDGLRVNLNGIEWGRRLDGGKTELTGMLSIPIITGKISIEVDRNDMWNNTEIMVLTEDDTWIAATDHGNVEYDGRLVHIYFDSAKTIKGVRICHGKIDENINWRINLYRMSYEELNTEDFSQNSPFEVVATTHQGFEHRVEEAVDNDNGTYWTAGYQEEGMVFAFTMKTPHRLSQIALDIEDEWYNVPKDLRIFVSSDEQEWSEIKYSSNKDVIFSFEPIDCQYVRLVLGPGAGVQNHWSIWEVLLFEES